MVRFRTAPKVLGLLAAAGLALYFAHLGLGVGAGSAGLDRGLYLFLFATAAVLCAARAVVRAEDRAGWALIALAVAARLASELHVADGAQPTIGDAFALAFYPATYVGLVLLARRRVVEFRRSLWLDGLIAALGISALSAAVLSPWLVTAGDGVLVAAVDLAYPLGDLILLCLSLAILRIAGCPPARPWALLATGLSFAAVADGLFLYTSVRGTYAAGELVDGVWPAALLMIAAAAWDGPVQRPRVALRELSMLLVPCAAAVVALVLVALGYVRDVPAAAVALAVATLAVVVLRMTLTVFEHSRLLRTVRRQATTDPLTRLGNRRALMDELADAVGLASEERPAAILLFDLDGFKHFNDTFGHPAGDALLARLGARLRAAVEGAGSAFRLGGDEFCVLLPPGRRVVEKLRGTTVAALTEHGDGYVVGTSCGVIGIPTDAATLEDAMRLADERLYADKRGRRLRPVAGL